MLKEAISAVVLTAGLCTFPAAAQVPWIAGTSSATVVSDPGSPHDGWYLYVMDISWDLDHQGVGLSHWDLLLKTGCAELDHLIEFPDPAGESTSDELMRAFLVDLSPRCLVSS